MNDHLRDLADRAVGYAAGAGAQYCDARAEEYERAAVRIENGRTEHAGVATDCGIGVRVAGAGAWGFFSVADPQSFGQIRRGIDGVLKGQAGEGIGMRREEPARAEVDYPVRERPDVEKMIGVGTECGRAMLDVPGVARSVVVPRYSICSKYFASSEGAQVRQDYTDVVMHMSATARDSGLAQSVDATEGGRGGMEMVTDGDVAWNTARDVARKASQLTGARPAKEAKTTVVMNPDFVALLAHEILGHPSEADRVMGKEMAWAGGAWWKGMVGQRIGSEELSVFDDPTIEGSLGWYGFDDEGVGTGRTALVQDGVLAGHMQSRETGGAFGVQATGNMRAASYRHMPLIRMACTCIAGGSQSPEEIIGGVKSGYLISNMKVPSIDMRRYNWSISCQYAHRIEDGEVTDLCRDVIVVGNAPEFFGSIDACGNDFAVRPITNCGKGDPMQAMAMGNGGPTVRGTATVRSAG